MSIPGQIIFIFAADYMHNEPHESTIGPVFISSYLTASLLQVSNLAFKKSILVVFGKNYDFFFTNGIELVVFT